jgi:hypothetical protein
MENNHNYSSAQLQDVAGRTEDLLVDLEQAIDWSNKFLRNDIRDKSTKQLKALRRRIKRIRYALARNPSAALYGESQVGKSYLVKNLLSRPGAALTITNPAKGQSHNFLEEINPKGDKVEATSVVTRFTTENLIRDPNYPVVVRLMSPKDIVLMLCDTFYSDVTDHISIPNNQKIEEQIKLLEETFATHQPSALQQALSEDDIYDIRDYLQSHLRSFTGDLINSNYWDFCAQLIGSVSFHDWDKIFGFLWGNNAHLNHVFNLLIGNLGRIDFVEEIHIEFSAVLRKHGTLLHVARLRELDGKPLYEDVQKDFFKSEVEYLAVGNDNNRRNGRINKSVLCALTAELVFRIDKEMEEDKPFLKGSDLLDFPGARSRLKNKEQLLSPDHIGNMVLRGKVSYIFNKYSSQYLTSNLLFCNKNENIEVKYIPSLLNEWIEAYIGETPEEREAFLKTSPLPPLFVIYTFFNEDLKYNSINDKEATLNEKWIKRFRTIFENEILAQDYDWHKNWTLGQRNFKNNYMLRDFHYSNLIYKGFDSSGKETGKQEFGMPDYLEKLKDSFLDFDFVQNHFWDPEETWTESAEMNKDGSELIIRNLTKVSNNIARTQKFIRELEAITKSIKQEMAKHHHSDDLDIEIKKSHQLAKQVQGDIDIVFGRHPYAFGRFIRKLTLRESNVYNLYKETLTTIEPIDKKTINEYILLRQANPELSIKKSYQENLDVLKQKYGLATDEEAEQYFKERNIILKELFYGDAYRLKSASLVLAEKLRDYWYAQNLRIDHYVTLLESGFTASSLESLFENMKQNFKASSIAEKIAHEIREYVDRYDKVEEAIEMISDISSGIINKFITSLGTAYYSKAKWEQLQTTSQANDLALSFHYSEPKTKFVENDEVSSLFDNMDRYDEYISQVSVDNAVVDKFPNIHNIARWRELMKIAFISTCDIPTYDPMANAALGEVLEKTKKTQIPTGS